VDGRPILVWNPQGLTDDEGGQVIRYILMVGTPTLWFLFAPAMLWLVWRIAARRDQAAVVAALGIAAGWLTWFVNLDRTMFIFYMAPALPFFVLAVTLVLQDVLGTATATGAAAATPFRRQLGLGAVCLYLAVVAMTFAYFYPVLTGQPLSHPEWFHRMWFPSWY
jgi:dolichyl-phosphate-mannose--protein O-mannosyl transferase